VTQIHWRRNQVKVQELHTLEIESRHAREDVHSLCTR